MTLENFYASSSTGLQYLNLPSINAKLSCFALNYCNGKWTNKVIGKGAIESWSSKIVGYLKLQFFFVNSGDTTHISYLVSKYLRSTPWTEAIRSFKAQQTVILLYNMSTTRFSLQKYRTFRLNK